MVDHVGAHLVHPFEHLWANVHEEGIRTPSSQHHDLTYRVAHEEQSHRRTRPNGPSSEICRRKAKFLFASCEGARGAGALAEIFVGDATCLLNEMDGVDRCVG